jgi:hypothetical protein
MPKVRKEVSLQNQPISLILLLQLLHMTASTHLCQNDAHLIN